MSIHKRVQGLHVIYTELIKVNKLGITKISSRSQDNKSNGNHYPRYNTEIVADDGSSTRKTGISCGYDGRRTGLKSAQMKRLYSANKLSCIDRGLK